MEIERRHESSRPNVVVLGGGNGTSSLLEGFRQYDVNLSAVVNTVDNGGSTGRLRQAFPGLIGLGDIRNCMVAMATNQDEAEKLQTRDDEGHAYGNLRLLEATLGRGGLDSVNQAIDDLGREIGMAGKVIPVTLDNSNLRMTYDYPNGPGEIVGEYQIAYSNNHVKKLGAVLDLTPEAHINPDAERAISQADISVVAPGNFYGSIIPTLLPKGVTQALESSKSKVVMVVNLLNCKITTGFSVDDYVDELYRLTRVEPDMIIAHNGVGLGQLSHDQQVRATAEKSARLMVADILRQEIRETYSNDELAALRSRLQTDGVAVGRLLLDNFGGKRQLIAA